MPLCEVEFRLQDQESWLKLRPLNPGNAPGSFSDVSVGRRDIYMFECSNNGRHTIISRSKFGIDYEAGKERELRVIETAEKPEIVRVLGKGESFEIEVVNDRGVSGTFRLTHK